MIAVRPEEPRDFPAIHELNVAAFAGDAEARLIGEMRNLPEYIPQLALVASEEARIVGHILFSTIVIATGTRNAGGLALGPMAVLPEMQRRGIGSLLVREGLRRARAMKYALVVVVGHPDYYPRFGFVPARKCGLNLLFPVPDEAWMVLELSDGALRDVSGVVHFAPVFTVD